MSFDNFHSGKCKLTFKSSGRNISLTFLYQVHFGVGNVSSVTEQSNKPSSLKFISTFSLVSSESPFLNLAFTTAFT